MADKRSKQLIPLALILCSIITFLSLRFGAVEYSIGQIWQALREGAQSPGGAIFWYSRLPRTAGCLLAGAALACSGCMLQSVLGNNLASPGVLGVNAGAGLAVTVCCACGALSGWSISCAAFAGAMLAVLVVVLLARKTRASRTTVILAGVAMNSMLGALRDAVTTLVPEAGMLSGEFRVGGFSAVVPARLLPAACLILTALLVGLLMCTQLDVLALGEDTARSLGMAVECTRTVFLLLAALLAGAAVSFAGLLGFVGLLVPHMARRLVGGESRFLLPMSILMGAGLVTACDLTARVVFAPYELPVGILMSVMGGPFFLWLLLKGRGGRSHA